MKYSRLISLLAASTMLVTFSAFAYDKDGDVKYDKDGDGKKHHHKKHHPEHRYTLTGGATYLAPAMNGIDYVTYDNRTVSTINTIDSYNLNPGYDWGYFLQFDYMISSRYDIQASWQQFNSSDSDSRSQSGPTNSLITSNDSFFFLDTGDTGTAITHETLDTQAFDANIGQIHKLSKTLTARPFLGVRYAKVDSETKNTYEVTGQDTVHDTYKSNFSGVGPEIGIDAEYTVWSKLGVVGHLGAAFLIGSLDADSNVFFSSDQNSVEVENETRIVPTLDAKLGLGWNSLYSNNSWGLGIEGGYQVAYYFQVVDQVQFDSTSEVINHNYSDVGIMGPYLNLSLDF